MGSSYRSRNGDSGVIQSHTGRKQTVALLGLAAGRNDIFPGRNALTNFHPIAVSRCVFDHDNRVRAGRGCRACRDRYCLPIINSDRRILRAPGSNLSNNCEFGGSALDVSGAHSITIARGSRERRKIAICGYRLGKNQANRAEQLCQFFASSTQSRRMSLYQMTRIFKAEDNGALIRRRH